MIDLQEMRKLCEKATPGPWNRGIGNDSREVFKNHGVHLAHVYDCNDGNFVAAARSAVPDLLDEVDRLRTEITEIQKRLNVATHISAKDKVGFDFAVLDEIEQLREKNLSLQTEIADLRSQLSDLHMGEMQI